MADLEFLEHRITARLPKLGDATTTIEAPMTVRIDPLTGRSARLMTDVKQPPIPRPDLSDLTADPPFCPFCASTIERATGLIDPAITDEGRIRRGSAVVVPNVVPYSEFPTVALYDTQRHFVDLPDLTPTLVSDLLEALVAYTRGVHGIRPMWHSINANYLPPSGSSVVHPHAQSSHDDVGTTAQRDLVTRSQAWPSGSYWDRLVAAEEGGERWIGRIGRVSFFTPWSPVGFDEVWGVVQGCPDLIDLTDDDCRDLATGMSAVFGSYHAQDLASFNWALTGGGPAPSDRYSVLLKMVSRSTPIPMYRSDATYFERLHGEAVIDQTPEQVAATVRAHFPGAA
ncbi:MAG TPA: hypothetical protein GXZ60_05560 [Intrasporangiaceae bacterium]|nr:hypothetical protein [Intrasporangiaceae bacterium]